MRGLFFALVRPARVGLTVLECELCAAMNKALTAFACLLLCPAFFAQTSEWPNYGNDPGGMRHSPLSQINSENATKFRQRPT